jgi:hypothetical protein
VVSDQRVLIRGRRQSLLSIPWQCRDQSVQDSANLRAFAQEYRAIVRTQVFQIPSYLQLRFDFQQ